MRTRQTREISRWRPRQIALRLATSSGLAGEHNHVKVIDV
jgi:hypothetical protein